MSSVITLTTSISRVWWEPGCVMMPDDAWWGEGSFPGEGGAWAEQEDAVDKPSGRDSHRRRRGSVTTVVRGLVSNRRQCKLSSWKKYILGLISDLFMVNILLSTWMEISLLSQLAHSCVKWVQQWLTKVVRGPCQQKNDQTSRELL